MSVAREVDWRYGVQEFHDMVDDALFLNTLLDLALLASKPKWDDGVLDRFGTPRLDDKNLQYTGYGFGGSFRGAISKPENYAVVATLHKRIFGDMPDMMDIDRKLPLNEPFGSFIEDRLVPEVIMLLKGYVFKQLRIRHKEKDVIFKGVMRRFDTWGGPQSVVTVRIVRYAHLTALEVRLSDVRKREDPKFPDFTIHLTKYERDLRVGPQMPASMNTLIPLYIYTKAEEGFSVLSNHRWIDSQQWMAVPMQQYLKMQADFLHPEVIAEPAYQTVEEAVHAGLRAIAEKMQHLGQYNDPRRNIPLEELLHGDWWEQYRKGLLLLLRHKKTEQSVLGRENKFLTSEVLKLFYRLNDYDSELFLRMAVPMGIMEALEPGFKRILYDYGHMVYGPSFSFSNPEFVDTVITSFCLEFPSWRGRYPHEIFYIHAPEQLGHVRLLTLLERYRKNTKMRRRGAVEELRRWLYSAAPYKI